MKPTKEIESEATNEGESTVEETGEYSHIDEFVKGLDTEELSYLKECLAKMPKESKGDDEATGEKEISIKDFENEE